MEIKILGPGCANCKALDKLVREVVAQNHIDATIEKIEDITEIMKYNILTMPALIVDGDVVLKGRVPSIEELKGILITKKK